jgi:hypothetical protein
MGLVGDFLADGGQIGLAVRLLEVGEERCPLAHQRHPTPEQITGGAHLGGLDRGLRDHPAAEQHGDLIGIKPNVVSLAPVNGLHVAGVAQDEGNPLWGAEVCEPIPRKDAFDTDDKMFPIGSNRLEKGLWACLQMPMDQYRSILI